MSDPSTGQRTLATSSVVLLLAWLALWFGLAAPPDMLPPILVIAVLWLPLLPALPMLRRGRRNACIWGSMIAVIYAGLALVELIANPDERLWASGALGLSGFVVVVLIRCARRWRDDTVPPG